MSVPVFYGGQGEQQGGQTENQGGQKNYQTNVCPPWTETLPAPLI